MLRPLSAGYRACSADFWSIWILGPGWERGSERAGARFHVCGTFPGRGFPLCSNLLDVNILNTLVGMVVWFMINFQNCFAKMRKLWWHHGNQSTLPSLALGMDVLRLTVDEQQNLQV